jgi:hypothetical protein
MRARAVIAAALAAGLLASACGGNDDGGRPHAARFEVGRGAAAAVVVRPAEQTRPTVVFLHGWGAVDPRAYGPWVRHLVARGSAVVLPRYQSSAVSLPAEALENALRGVRAAFARLPGERDWVAARTLGRRRARRRPRRRRRASGASRSPRRLRRLPRARP